MRAAIARENRSTETVGGNDLEPIEILRYVRIAAKEIWDEVFDSEAEAINNLLPTKFGRSAISVSLNDNGNNPNLAFARLLSDPTVQQRFTDALKMDGLFQANSKADIEAVIARCMGDRYRPKRVTEIAFAPEPDRFRLSGPETTAIDAIVAEMSKGGRPFISWRADYAAGASFLLSRFGQNAIAQRLYHRAFLVHPSKRSAPFDTELTDLSERLGVRHGPEWGATFFKALTDSGTLLVLGSMHAIRDAQAYKNAGLLEALIRAARMAVADWDDRPPVLMLVGRAKAIPVLPRFDISDHVDEKLNVPVSDRASIFQQQWLRFCELRGLDPAGEIGSRVKRADWHYGVIKNRKVWPINLRLRAFFASNFDNPAFFDPTGGFEQLAGRIAPPEDIAWFKQEVLDHLDHMPQTSREPLLRLLQFMSTAKYWLTPNMRDLLRPGTDKSLTDKELREALSELIAGDDPVGKKPTPETVASAVTQDWALGIGLKSVIQDRWMQKDKLSRSLSHWRIARELFEKRNDKHLLAREFPFSPTWGRSRPLFVAETIRHLLRACQTVPEGKLSGEMPLRVNDFAAPPVAALGGCDPRDIMDYCFGTLYQFELNGEVRGDRNGPSVSSRKQSTNRNLTKRYGAYAMAYELLQLMSQPGAYGKPHWALPDHYHREFLRECGFAALNVGDLAAAERCFDAVLIHERLMESHAGEAAAYLHLSLVRAARGETEKGFDDLSAAATAFKRAPDAANSSNAARRIAARKAQLLYLGGDYAQALSMLLQLWRSNYRITEPELLVAFIDLLEWARAQTSDDSRKDHPDALELCVRALFRKSSDGFHHDAISYKIAFARLLRLRKHQKAAEAILDEVHVDIVANGCSERTYLAFLLEAAQVLMDDNRPVRAYASYLRPCLRRTAALGFRREEGLARSLAIDALEGAASAAEAIGEAEWRKVLKLEAEADKAYRSRDRPNDEDRDMKDPLYGYALGQDEADAVIRSLDLSTIRSTLLGL